MTQRILFVDDEPNVLDGLRRVLRKHYEYDTATSGAEALELVAANPYAVVVSDMRMPGMMGDELLAKVSVEQPDAVLMILSGQADMSSMIAAVNNSNLHRFLVKPVDGDSLAEALDGALDHHRLIQGERELLDGTLSGAVSALTQVVALVNPAATRRTNHVVEIVGRLAPVAGLQNDWQLRLAAMLSGVGFSAVPGEVVERFQHGDELDVAETRMIEQHGRVAMQLLGSIPRLEGVAGIIGAQAGVATVDTVLTRHVEVLDVAVAVSTSLLRGRKMADIIAVLRERSSHDVALLDALDDHTEPELVLAEIGVQDLRPGMILRFDVMSATDVLLAATNQILNGALIQRIANFQESAGVIEPILVAYEKVDAV